MVTHRQLFSLILLGAIWGGSFLFMRVTVTEFGAIPLIELRLAIGALVLLPFMLVQHGKDSMRGHWFDFSLVGVLNSALPFTLIAYALLYFTSGVASVLNATVPMFTAIVAYLWLKEKLTRSRVLGLVIGFAGVLVLVGDKLAIGNHETSLALIASLTATLSYAIAANYVRRFLTGISSILISTMSLVLGSVLMLPLAIWYWPAQNPSLSAWLSVIVLGAICTGLAYLIFYRLIAEIGASRTVTVTFLVPLFGIVWGITFLGESITWQITLGSLIIISGTALATGVLKLAWFETSTVAKSK